MTNQENKEYWVSRLLETEKQYLGTGIAVSFGHISAEEHALMLYHGRCGGIGQYILGSQDFLYLGYEQIVNYLKDIRKYPGASHPSYYFKQFGFPIPAKKIWYRFFMYKYEDLLIDKLAEYISLLPKQDLIDRLKRNGVSLYGKEYLPDSVIRARDENWSRTSSCL